MFVLLYFLWIIGQKYDALKSWLYFSMLYESSRRKPGWRFTAGFECGVAEQLASQPRKNDKCVTDFRKNRFKSRFTRSNWNPRKTFLHQSVLYQMVTLVWPGYGFIRDKSSGQSCTYDAKNVKNLRSAWRRSETKKSPILAPKRWFLNKKWLVEHHPVCSVRVIRGRGAASLPNRKKWQICCKFCGNWVLIEIYTFKFKSQKTIPTSKRALSDGNVGLTRLWVYRGEKHGAKLDTWRQKMMKFLKIYDSSRINLKSC